MQQVQIFKKKVYENINRRCREKFYFRYAF